MSAVAALRDLLDRRFPDATPVTRQTARPVPTGVAELDGILPQGGLPRGRVTVWAPRGGAAALLRAACHAAIAAGERAAWVDGEGTIAGAYWDDGPLLLRPAGRMPALRAVEQLLRSGGFALVVLTGLDAGPREAVRLSRAVHEGGGAFVAVTHASALASLRLASRLVPSGCRWRRNPFGEPALAEQVTLRIEAQALGWNRSTELLLPVVSHDLRLSLEPGLADRRGLDRSRAGRLARGR
ncbi:MAG: hypothetical protein ACOY71_09990, partial [Gemmatimonadota bacterium]